MTDPLDVLILSGHMTREHDNEHRSFRLHNQWITTLLEDTGRSRVRVVEDPRGLRAAQLLVSRVGARMADAAWRHYRHRFAGKASRAEHTAADLDFSTDLMRLATGGSAGTAA